MVQVKRDVEGAARLALTLLDADDAQGARRVLAHALGEDSGVPDQSDSHFTHVLARCTFGPSRLWSPRYGDVTWTRASDDLDFEQFSVALKDTLAKYVVFAYTHADPDPADPKQPWKFLLESQRAQQSVTEKSLARAVVMAREVGLTQREIASLIDEPQTHVHRRLRAIDDDPNSLALGPREIVDRFTAGQFHRETMLMLLAAYPYELGEQAAESSWGYVPGSWDELADLALEGHITENEFETIVKKVESRRGTT